MMGSFFDWLAGWNTRLESIAGVGGALGVIALCFAKVRRGVMAFFRSIKTKWVAPDKVLQEIRLMSEYQREARNATVSISDRLASVEQELRPSGKRSMSQNIAVLMGQHRHSFTTQNRPAFQCDVSGNNLMVSEAYCVLVEATSEEDLVSLGWMQFVFTEDGPGLLQSFVVAAASRSPWRGVARLVSKTGTNLGKWELRAVPIGKRDDGEALYSGHLSPLDEIAKTVAGEYRWAC